jgi:hypothetical protein
MWVAGDRGWRCAQGVAPSAQGESLRSGGEGGEDEGSSRLPASSTQQKHEPGLEGRARAGRGRGFSEGGGIGDPGSLSAPIYVAGRTADSWTRVMGDYSLRSW